LHNLGKPDKKKEKRKRVGAGGRGARWVVGAHKQNAVKGGGQRVLALSLPKTTFPLVEKNGVKNIISPSDSHPFHAIIFPIKGPGCGYVYL